MTERTTQQAMDGSPAVVFRTIETLAVEGKFSGGALAKDVDPADPVILIRFQCGPIKEVGVNGCSIEHVIDVLVERLEGFQAGPFRCRENALAITKLEEAKHWLLYRTKKRVDQGVEGTNRAHVS